MRSGLPVEAQPVSETTELAIDGVTFLPETAIVTGASGGNGGAIVDVASDEASYINGVTLCVDGGILHGFWANRSLVPPVPRKSDAPGG